MPLLGTRTYALLAVYNTVVTVEEKPVYNLLIKSSNRWSIFPNAGFYIIMKVN
jgi:hypothetical protein